MKTASEIFARMLKDMCDDNGTNFLPTADQVKVAEAAVQESVDAGFEWTRGRIMEMAAGDIVTFLEEQNLVPGISKLSRVLDEIFDGPNQAYQPWDHPVPDGYELLPELQEKKKKSEN